jgi:predicted PurR-regulated permease PerM
MANIVGIVEAMPEYQEKLSIKISQVNHAWDLNLPSDFSGAFQNLDLVQVTGLLLRTATDIASNAGVIIIYLVFMLIEYTYLDQKLEALFAKGVHLNRSKEIIAKIGTQVGFYLRIKTLISLATALASYAVMEALQIDFPIFCAFLIFILNYIPTIGSIVATVFPCIIAFVQFDTFAPLILLILGLALIQFALGNVIEPRVMGSSFNLSGLLIILSLMLWGYLWGIIGMILSVPILVILSIILTNFPQTRWLAILMSQNGNIDEESEQAS